MADEIERKFLVSKLPDDLENYDKIDLIQGYIDVGKDNPSELRIRRKFRKGLETYLLAVKSGGGLKRSETEIEVPAQVYNTLFPLTANRRIYKTRYLIPSDSHTVELDIYSGNLTGLTVAEVEFTSVEASEDFVPLPWFGKEVTEDNRYKNKKLATKGLPN